MTANNDDVVRFLAPTIAGIENMPIEEILEAFEDDRTERVLVSQEDFLTIFPLLGDLEAKFGIVFDLEEFEDEWIEGTDDVLAFSKICAHAATLDPTVSAQLLEIAELAKRASTRGTPIIIET